MWKPWRLLCSRWDWEAGPKSKILDFGALTWDSLINLNSSSGGIPSGLRSCVSLEVQKPQCGLAPLLVSCAFVAVAFLGETAVSHCSAPTIGASVVLTVVGILGFWSFCEVLRSFAFLPIYWPSIIERCRQPRTPEPVFLLNWAGTMTLNPVSRFPHILDFIQ